MGEGRAGGPFVWVEISAHTAGKYIGQSYRTGKWGNLRDFVIFTLKLIQIKFNVFLYTCATLPTCLSNLFCEYDV